MAQQRTPPAPDADDAASGTCQLAVPIERSLRSEFSEVAREQGMRSAPAIRRLMREHIAARKAGRYPWILRPSDLEHPDQDQVAA